MQQEKMDNVKGPVVQTEARKIIIKGLPRDTREDALITHINSSAIQHVEFARHSDGRLKGHAFVIFDSHRIAKKVVDTIDGQRFQNRPLRATLAKEGVEPFEAFHQHQQQHGYLTPESSTRTSQSPSMPNGKVDERQQVAPKENRDAQWDDNGEGSSKSAKGKEKAREGSSDDRGRKNRPKSREPTRGTPAVVDGSGRKRH